MSNSTDPNQSPPRTNPWEARYITGDTPWEKGAPSPGLVDFLARQKPEPRGSVLVPGCGTGHDARAWASHGFPVLGMDLAPSAVELARAKSSGGTVEPIYRQGDFLRDPVDQAHDWVFEHTLFCAIHPSERPLYVEAVRRWLKPTGKYLAVFYLIPDEEGPPFGACEAEIRERFEPSFRLEEAWVPRSYPNRQGLEWMTLWTPRQRSELGSLM